jgi:2-polyprenyl-3-methyl-5-hydroxy-6-metoxy-1,4-benzoquinol methylase
MDKPKLNDINILQELKNSCYTGNDIRASWISQYDTDTDIHEFKNYARWSLQHWNMYKGFLDHITQDNKELTYILDAACGVGYNTKMISEYTTSNTRLYGIDLDNTSISIANKYNSASNIIYKVDDLFNCSFDHEFDYIFFLEILEHITADKHHMIINKLLHLLKPNGLLFLSTPNELDNPDALSEHIGLLNRERAKQFIATYSDNIVDSKFYDNLKLDTSNYTIDEPIHTYEHTSSGVGGIQYAPNKSHFKIVLKRIDTLTELK